jgi:hypothetical protein
MIFNLTNFVYYNIKQNKLKFVREELNKLFQFNDLTPKKINDSMISIKPLKKVL